MSRRHKNHDFHLPGRIEAYAKSRSFEYHKYSIYHMRVIDKDFTIVDMWTSGKYWIMQTNYYLQTKTKIVERAGEKGILPNDLAVFLDAIFFAADIIEEAGP